LVIHRPSAERPHTLGCVDNPFLWPQQQMSYPKSSVGHLPGSSFGKQLGDGPIRDFAIVIEKTTPEDWVKRTQALSSLVATIPSGSDYVAVEAWYNTPSTLRHLACPLAELLKDPRSTVVIKTCESSGELFGKCQMDARYLLKDIMPTVLSLHAQTVQVIRQAVQDMVVDAMAVTPCKMVMPIWLDRLKADKSKTVREACAMYLGVGLNEWTEPGYLSLQIWEQVGTALIKALRDPAPTVRQHAKKGLEVINRVQSAIFDRLLANSDLLRDVRVRKTLERIQSGESVADDVSVASYSSRGAGSVASTSRRRGGVSMSNGGVGAGSSSVTGSSRGGRRTARPTTDSRPKVEPIPMTIGVTTKWNPSTRDGRGLGPPGRVPATAGSLSVTVESPPRVERMRIPEAPSANGRSTVEAQQTSYPAPTANGVVVEGIPDIPPSNASFETMDTNESDLPVIANVDELREYAKSQGSNRRCSTLQERFARSTQGSSMALLSSSLSNLEDTSETNEGKDPGTKDESEVDEANKETTTSSRNIGNGSVPVQVVGSTSEHVQIAWALLEAHKKHVDLIMETLKVEMDALKEFEKVMKQSTIDPSRPSEDEVLEYVESVGLCVEQRAKAGTILQKKMDRISNV